MATEKIIFPGSIRWSEEEVVVVVESNNQETADKNRGRWFTGLYQIIMGR
jgi:hypothetical protein